MKAGFYEALHSSAVYTPLREKAKRRTYALSRLDVRADEGNIQHSQSSGAGCDQSAPLSDWMSLFISIFRSAWFASYNYLGFVIRCIVPILLIDKQRCSKALRQA